LPQVLARVRRRALELEAESARLALIERAPAQAMLLSAVPAQASPSALLSLCAYVFLVSKERLGQELERVQEPTRVPETQQPRLPEC
jgi:hypothetical protein